MQKINTHLPTDKFRMITCNFSTDAGPVQSYDEEMHDQIPVYPEQSGLIQSPSPLELADETDTLSLTTQEPVDENKPIKQIHNFAKCAGNISVVDSSDEELELP